MNTLMIATLVVGSASMLMLRRKTFPEFELEIVLVSVPYPGASPEEVEEGICQKIEESVRGIDGIKRQTAIATEGAGFLVLELDASSNVQKILNEVRSEVDSIPSFPALAEQPDVKQITYRIPAIRIGVTGNTSAVDSRGTAATDSSFAEQLRDNAEWRLRDAAEKVRDDLVQLSTVSQADILVARDYQIDVEIPESKLREHGLSLQEVARIVRRENVELPGGTMKTRGQDVLLRGKNKQMIGRDIAQLPVLKDPSGDVITVSDLGSVRDGFTDTYSVCEINGQPGLVISVNRTKSEDLLSMAAGGSRLRHEYESPGLHALLLGRPLDRCGRSHDHAGAERAGRPGTGVHRVGDLPGSASLLLGCVGNSRLRVRRRSRLVVDRRDVEHAVDVRLPDGSGDCGG